MRVQLAETREFPKSRRLALPVPHIATPAATSVTLMHVDGRVFVAYEEVNTCSAENVGAHSSNVCACLCVTHRDRK